MEVPISNSLLYDSFCMTCVRKLLRETTIGYDRVIYNAIPLDKKKKLRQESNKPWNSPDIYIYIYIYIFIFFFFFFFFFCLSYIVYRAGFRLGNLDLDFQIRIFFLKNAKSKNGFRRTEILFQD